MSKLMDELMAEIERVNELQTEVERTVANQSAQIKADREARMERPRAFITKMGWALGEIDKDHRVYTPDIPLDVYLNGKQLFLNYSVEPQRGGKRTLLAYGGYLNQIEFRVGKNGIFPDYEEQQDFVNAIIDQWDDECEQKLEYRIVCIIKEKMAERMKSMQKKLADSNNKYEEYFRK